MDRPGMSADRGSVVFNAAPGSSAIGIQNQTNNYYDGFAAQQAAEFRKHINQVNPDAIRKRIRDDKDVLNEDVYRWALEDPAFLRWHSNDDPDSRLLWVKGDPGKGKTMLLCGMVDKLPGLITEKHVLAFFFCQSGDPRINSAESVIRGLIRLLLERHPEQTQGLVKWADDIAPSNPGAWQSLRDIFDTLLGAISLDGTYIYLLVDALDECDNDRDRDNRLILDLITCSCAASPRVKWIVSSRNVAGVERGLKHVKEKLRLSLEINASFVSAAVDKYIQSKVDRLAKDNDYGPKTRSRVADYLSSHSEGTFLWVALVCRQLASVEGWRVRELLDLFPRGLDPLYGRMMSLVEGLETRLCAQCKDVLSTILIAHRPVTIHELAVLADIRAEYDDDGHPGHGSRTNQRLVDTVYHCGSFLTMRDDTVRFVHQSASEFLRNIPDQLFRSGIQAWHLNLFQRSLRILSKTLRRDMYGLETTHGGDAPAMSVEQVDTPPSDPLISVRYSCQYWADHLLESGSTELMTPTSRSYQLMSEFFADKFIYWLEALSLLGSLALGMEMIGRLAAFLSSSDHKAPGTMSKDSNRCSERGMTRRMLDKMRKLQRRIRNGSASTTEVARIGTWPGFQDKGWVRLEAKEVSQLAPTEDSLHTETLSSRILDARRFMMQHRGVIERFPMQTYAPALMFSPSNSITRTQFAKYSPQYIARSATTEMDWHAQMFTLVDAEEGWAEGIAWSPDGKWLATVHQGKEADVKGASACIWSPSNGRRLASFCHGLGCASLAWAPDSTKLAVFVLVDKSAAEVQIFDPSNTRCPLLSYPVDISRLHAEAADDPYRQIFSDTFQRTRYLAWAGDVLLMLHPSRDYILGWNQTTNSQVKSIGRERQAEPARILDFTMVLAVETPRIAILYANFDIELLDLLPDDQHSTLCRIQLPPWPSFGLEWSPDGVTLAAHFHHTVVVCNGETGNLHTQELAPRTVEHLAWSWDGTRLLLAERDGGLSIWDRTATNILHQLSHQSGPVLWKTLAWSPSGLQLASVQLGVPPTVWDAVGGHQMRDDSSNSTYWSPNGARVAILRRPALDSQADVELEIWEAAAVVRARMPGFGYPQVMWSQDGSRLAFLVNFSQERQAQVCVIERCDAQAWRWRRRDFNVDACVLERVRSSALLMWECDHRRLIEWDPNTDVTTITENSGPPTDEPFPGSLSRQGPALTGDEDEGLVRGASSKNPGVGRRVSQVAEPTSYGLDANATWIVRRRYVDGQRKEERLIAIPPEYPPENTVVTDHTISMSSNTGQALIFRFKDAE